ncbi:hypothetical protein [Prolixibacter sp. NT017]|nr:hypothetical protein [Prolixibacter sp. NT017]
MNAADRTIANDGAGNSINSSMQMRKGSTTNCLLTLTVGKFAISGN